MTSLESDQALGDDLQRGDSDGRPTERVLPTWAFRTLVAVTVLPIVVAIVAVFRADWWPTSDLALEYLRSTDVGTSHTPLVGQYSRFTFNHPGPAMFYVFAPFTRLFGPIGMYVATGVVNALCIAGTVVVTRRRAGDLGALVASLMCLGLIASMGAELSIDPWNPTVGIFPLLFAVICAWGVCDGDVVVLPLLVAAGSYAFQAHLGYGGLVAILWAAPVVTVLARHRRSSIAVLRRHRRPVLISVAVFVVFWLPPAFQQIRNNPGNFVSVWRTLTGSNGPVVGFDQAVHLVSGAFVPNGSWLRLGGTSPQQVVVHTASPVWFVTIVVVTLSAGLLAAARGAPRARNLAVLVVALDLAGLWSASNIEGEAAHYLLQWLWPLGALTWFSIVFSLICILSTRRSAGMAWVVGAIALVGSLALVPRAASAEPIDRRAGVAVRSFADVVATHLDRNQTYELKWLDDRILQGIGSGFEARLEDRGFRVLLPWSPVQPYKVGAARVVRRPGQVDTVLHVSGTAGDPRDLPLPEGQRVLMYFDAAPKALRPRRRRLLAAIKANTARQRKDFTAALHEHGDQAELQARLAEDVARGKRLEAEVNRINAYGENYLVTVSKPN